MGCRVYRRQQKSLHPIDAGCLANAQVSIPSNIALSSILSRIQAFLQSLSDKVLAYLYTYKYAGYFDESRALVDAELKKRGLEQPQIQTYLQEANLSHYDACRRCGSRKHMETDIEKWNTSKSGALDGLLGRTSYTQHSECLVCGLVLYDGNEPNAASPLHTRLWRMFLAFISAVAGSL
jgi:ribosomal protein L37E